MPPEALALALTAAVVHAVWNLLLAGARDSQAFGAIVLLVGAVVGAPAAALFWGFERAGWPFVVATCALELTYFALLAYAYTHAELSVVYPLARGLAPVLVLGGAVVLTGAGTTPRQVAGVLLVGSGILLVRGVRRGRGALLAVLIACVIATYTVVDKHGVRYVSPLAYLEIMSAVVGVAYAGWIVAARGAGALRAELNRRSVAAGIGTFAAYACVLFALHTPLVFMGEEYEERNPFLFFTDHIDPTIADATREGRRREVARTSGSEGDAPDPQALDTFERSKLAPRKPDPLFRELLALRGTLPRELDVDSEGERVILTRGSAALVLDFGAHTVELRS